MNVCPVKTQISLSICPVWSEASPCAQWVAKDPGILHADSEDSDQSFVGFVMRWLIFNFPFLFSANQFETEICCSVEKIQNLRRRKWSKTIVLIKGECSLKVYCASKWRNLQTLNFDTNLIKIGWEESYGQLNILTLVEWVLPFWIFNEVSQIFKIIFERLYFS